MLVAAIMALFSMSKRVDFPYHFSFNSIYVEFRAINRESLMRVLMTKRLHKSKEIAKKKIMRHISSLHNST